MLDDIRLYFRYVGISLRSQMQYRASFVMLSLGHLVATGTEFLGVWALLDRFGNVRGWRLPEVMLFYGMINVSFALSEGIARGFDTFGDMVKSGDFDRLLVRPRSTALQVAGRELQLLRIGRFTQGLAVLIAGATMLEVHWSLAKIALLVGAIIGGTCLFNGLFVLTGTLAFWTTESLEITNTVTYGGVETAQFPLTIYRPWFRTFFVVIVPLACANYFPALAILGRPDPLGTPKWLAWASPIVGALFFTLSLRVWELGVRRYRSTGS